MLAGKMVVMGTPTEARLKLAARRCAKIIMRIGFPVQFHDFKVVNMLATCDTRFPVRIEGHALIDLLSGLTHHSLTGPFDRDLL